MIRRLLLLIVILALPLARAHAQCAMPTEDLVGYWKLNETSGTTATATVGPNGSMLGGLSGTNDSVAGQVGTALDLDSNDSISVADNAALESSAYMTASAWVKANAIGSDMKVLYKNHSVSPWEGWEIYITSTGEATFQVVNTTSNYFSVGSDPIIFPGQWYHIAGVNNNGVLSVYVNGVKSEQWNTGPVTGSYLNSNGALVFGATPFLNGVLDDIRIYNRVLSPDEIMGLAATRADTAPAGYMVYDPRHARMIYCNGTNWVNAGIGPYNPNAVEFDGTNDYLSHAGGLTLPDSNKFTGSFWIRRNGGTGTARYIFDTGVQKAFVGLNAGNQIQIYGDKVGVGTALDLRGSTAITDTNWHHVMFSIDLSDTAKRFICLDGVAETLVVTTYNTADTIDFTNVSTTIGATSVGANKLPGDLAELWIDFDTYLDVSIAANRAKFRSASGTPMYLGPDGAIPTGSKPEVFLSGSTTNWETNLGTGGGFTENGALTTSTSQPADSKIPASGDISAGLIGYWKLDESTGITAIDSKTGNNGTLNNFPASPWLPTGGGVNGALDFDGVDDKVSVGVQSAYNNLPALTVSAWIKPRTIGESGAGMIVHKNTAGSSGAPANGWLFRLDTTNTVKFFVDYDVTDLEVTSEVNTLPYGQWSHVIATWNGGSSKTDVKLYINGVETAYRASQTLDGATTRADDSTAGLQMGNSATTARTFDGLIDDVRLYNRVLSAAEAKLLYSCGGPKGTMKYDDTYNVMSYCTGAEWVAMGPVGGTPPTSGLVSHWKLDESTGTTATDSVGSNNGTLNGTPTWNPVGGLLGGALTFDGGGDFVSISDTAALDGGTNFSVATWVKFSASSASQSILAKNHTVAPWGSWLLDYGATSKFQFQVVNNAGTWFGASSTTPPLVVGQWYHLVGVKEGSLITLYVNGTAVKSDSTFTGTVFDSNSEMAIGGNGNYTFGDIDDVRFYSRALSPQEVSQLYYFGLSGGLGDVNNTCANAGPITGSTAEGKMFYNADHNVMQYCNGERWVGIGK